MNRLQIPRSQHPERCNFVGCSLDSTIITLLLEGYRPVENNHFRANARSSVLVGEELALKATRRCNSTGETLVQRLRRPTGRIPYITGALIFGIESDTVKSLDQTIRFAGNGGVALA